MSLTEHAERELRAAGLFDNDSDYDGMLGDAVLELIKVFAGQGHSGMSAGIVTSLFEKLARYEPLGPLTGEDDEWVQLDYGNNIAAQNKRCGHVFKRADGTAYDGEGRVFRESNGACHTSSASRVDITFPYTPVTEYVDVPEGGE